MMNFFSRDGGVLGLCCVFFSFLWSFCRVRVVLISCIYTAPVLKRMYSVGELCVFNEENRVRLFFLY